MDARLSERFELFQLEFHVRQPLPTFRELRRQGLTVLTRKEAERLNLRALHVGLLNMMPDAAFQVTEQQFVRLVGSSSQQACFYVAAASRSKGGHSPPVGTASGPSRSATAGR